MRRKRALKMIIGNWYISVYFNISSRGSISNSLLYSAGLSDGFVFALLCGPIGWANILNSWQVSILSGFDNNFQPLGTHYSQVGSRLTPAGQGAGFCISVSAFHWFQNGRSCRIGIPTGISSYYSGCV